MTKRDPRPEPNGITAMVLGLGAIGRLTAQHLAALHVSELHLVDHRVVTRRDGPSAGYFAEDIGRLRIHATAQLCHGLNPDAAVFTHRRLPRRSPHTAAVFVCSDADQTQRLLATDIRTGFVGQAFVDGPEIHVLSGGRSRVHLRRTRSSGAAAMIAAGLLIDQFHRWMAGETPVAHIRLNLAHLRFGVQPS